MLGRSLTICLLAGCLGILGCKDDSQKAEPVSQGPPPKIPVEIVRVSVEQVPVWLEYTGKTEASKRVEVRARVAGRLDEALFTEGDTVTEGEKLFGIEKDTYQAALSQAKAKLESTRASLKLAQADVDRYKPLVAEGLAPRVTLEQNEARVAELEAAIKADLARIDDAELNLSYTDVVAPISGKISKSFVDVGNIVGYGEKTLLTTIIADDPMYAYFSPGEEAFQIIQKFRSREVLDAVVRVPVRREGLLNRGGFRGVVDFKDNRVERMTGTITMRATVANPDRELLEGTFVYVEMFVTDQPEFIMVSPSVIQEDQRGSFLYVVDEASKVKRVDIERGFDSRYYTSVTKGLQGGERVIISNLARLRPEVLVEPRDVTDEKGVMATLKEKNLLSEKE